MLRPRQLTYFTVTGSGLFPVDMLRFDSAWPSSPEDAALIFGADFGFACGPGPMGPRQRRSIRMGCAQVGGPTTGRWSSFGWTVMDAADGYAA